MHISLDYYHATGDFGIKFSITHPNEEAYGFGIGSTPKEAEKNMKGLFTKESEHYHKRFKIDFKTPYIHLVKKMNDGMLFMTDKPLNLPRNIEPAPEQSITVFGYDF